MSNTPQQNHLGQLPQMFAQYQQNIEMLNNNLVLIRQKLQQPGITESEKEQLKKQEQDHVNKVTMLQTLMNNLTPQIVAQNLQQRVLMNQQQQQMGSPAPHPENMNPTSNPGSPASFNPQQQQQQQQPQQGQMPLNAGQLAAQALAVQQQQLRNAQQQQQQQTQQQALQQQQQQVLNNMGLASNQQLNQNAAASVTTASNTASPQTTNFASPMMQQSPNNTGTQMKTNMNTGGMPATSAASSAKNTNPAMFTFSSNPQSQSQQQQQPTNIPAVTTAGASTSNTAAATNTLGPAPLKPATAPSLDNDGVHRMLTKRKIQELVSQIDPAERLEPEVEDILLEIADEFIESVTTFACQLAKHRKSNTLEVKDVQLHLERNWNIRIPGFAADDIRSLRKPNISSSHQAKVQAVNAAKNQPTKKEHHPNNSSNI